MTIGLGQAVSLKTRRISTAGGTETELAAGRIGRVCKKYSSGFCCVQFGGNIGCRRVHENGLQRENVSAPQCSAACRGGCW